MFKSFSEEKLNNWMDHQQMRSECVIFPDRNELQAHQNICVYLFNVILAIANTCSGWGEALTSRLPCRGRVGIVTLRYQTKKTTKTRVQWSSSRLKKERKQKEKKSSKILFRAKCLIGIILWGVISWLYFLWNVNLWNYSSWVKNSNLRDFETRVLWKIHFLSKVI